MEENSKKFLFSGVAVVLVIMGAIGWASHQQEAEQKAAFAASDAASATAQAAFRIAKAKEDARVAALTPAQRAAEERAKKKQELAAAADKKAKERQEVKLASFAAKAKAERAKYLDTSGNMMRPGMAHATVEVYLGHALDDPDSLKMGECGPLVMTTGGWIIDCQYRAKNGFNALRLQQTQFYIRYGRVVGTK